MRAHFDDDLELQLAKIALIALVILWFALPFLTSKAQAQTLGIGVPEPTLAVEVSTASGAESTPGAGRV